MRAFALIVASWVACPLVAGEVFTGAARVPAVPLVSCDPYFSIWSAADRLTDVPTTHWTGKPHRLTSLVRIDGKTFRVMGADPGGVPALRQSQLTLSPTRTVYVFEGEGISLTLTFVQPALPGDLDILSRPTTYLVWDARSTDGKPHSVSVYIDAAAEIAVNLPRQEVAWSRETFPGLAAMRVGSRDQAVLAKDGDDLRIDWGYFYLASPTSQKPVEAMGDAARIRSTFASGADIGDADSDRQPRPADDASPALALMFDLGQVSSTPAKRWVILAYDDLFSIQYFKRNLRPYWRRNGMDAGGLLARASTEFESIARRCEAFDTELTADLDRVGGPDYARLCALAYRQCFAANKFVADDRGAPLSFSKENFSNGCIGTVDVMYPMAPQFLLFGATLSKSMLVPIMDYASSPRWKFPFAPHDLGRYPHANKQRYGGGELTEDRQMPVEETGNMLILLAALSKMEGNADFAGKYWPTIERWAAYLKEKGFDPENQLCTDDFAGHLAHNVNLSAKAICGIASFAQLCRARGDAATADAHHAFAKESVERWIKEADDGDHFRLAFDQPGTWSQKYNLVWDRILGLDLFPPAVAKKEMAFYRKMQNEFGLPLDNRKTYTKLDWILWTATLTGDRDDFNALLGPVTAFIARTPDRIPMTDWYDTISGKKRGFQARSVVGGVFLKVLYDQKLWKKWASSAAPPITEWAPFPKAPETVIVVPAADRAPATWRYCLENPGPKWSDVDFDAAAWPEGKSGFGSRGTPGAQINTDWKSKDIWLRRTFELPEKMPSDLHLWMHHDEDAEIFINGIRAAAVNGYTTGYDAFPLSGPAKASLKPGKNVIAIHCRQTKGGQYIDAGLIDLVVP